MAALVPTLTNGSFKNWLKGALGILFAKEGLTDFVKTEFTQFQTDLLQSVWSKCGIPAGTTCNFCTTANLLKCHTQGFCNTGHCKIHDPTVPEKIPNQPCPNRICDALMIAIRKKHRYKGPSLKNTDARRWCMDPFELAKCFLPPDGYFDIHSFEETDFNGTLSVIINNKRFQGKLATQLNTDQNTCIKAREIGKAVRHSPDLLLTDADLAQFITDLINLLTDPTYLASDHKAKTAVNKLKELQTNTLTIHANDITQIIHDNIRESISRQHQAVLQDIQSHLGTVQTASIAAINEIIGAKLTALDEIGKETEKKKTEINLHTGLKKQDLDKHTGLLKKCIDVHADQTEQDIDVHSDQKKHDMDVHVDQKLQDIDVHADKKKQDIDTHVDQKTQDIDMYTEKKKKEIAVLRKKILKTGNQIKEEEYAEFKKHLIGFYRNHHSKIQLSPLVEGNDVDLLEFYVEPPMTAIDLQRKFGNPRKTPVKISKQLLYRDDQNAFKNIYVTAGPGLGKTSFSKRICMAWCQAHDPVTTLADKFDPDEVLALKSFEFLFLIPLRDATKSRCDLDEIIRAYLQRQLSDDYLKMPEPIFNESSCLILLDGLDEWSHPVSCSTGDNAREVPHRKFRKNWTILTTTRPWKFDEIRLASHQIDSHVEINELDEEASQQLVVNGVNLLNQRLTKDKQKSVGDFCNTISLIKLGEIRNVPYIYLQCLCLWFEEKDIGGSKCEIYFNIIELTLRRGIEKIKSGVSLPLAQADSRIHLPTCIMGTRYCKQHLLLLLKLGKMAFYALFDGENRQRLVLDVTFARKFLKQEEMEVCLKLGLLSQNKVYGLLSERISNISFLHKSIQECFAALYMQSYNRNGEEVQNIVVQTCTSLPSILNMSNVFIFLSGFRPGVYSELFSLIMQRVSEDQNIYNYRTNKYFERKPPEYRIMLDFQTMQVDCVEEMLANKHEISDMPLDDILIDKKSKHETYIFALHKLVHGNQSNIKSFSIGQCENTEEVTHILETLDLQYIHSLYKLHLQAVARQPDVEQLLRQSISTLQYLHLGYNIYNQGKYFSKRTVLSKVCEEMILSMTLLNSLGLTGLIVTHYQLENVATFLTSRVTMINIFIQNIICSDHCKSCHGVKFNLSGHDNIQLLGVDNVPVFELNVNIQHLEQLTIGSLPSKVITSCLASLQAAHDLHILHCYDIKDTEIHTLITTLPSLSRLETLYITRTDLTDSRLDLKTNMTRLRYILLYKVSMTSSALRALSRTVTSLSQSVTVALLDCTVTPEVEYEAVKEEIRKSDILTVTCDGHGEIVNEFVFTKEN